MKIITVGKSPECDVILKGDTVSRLHAQIAVYDNHIEIIDLESTNGTFVNGQKIKAPTKLNEGDAVVLGGAFFDWESLDLVRRKIEVQPQIKFNKKKKSTAWIYVTSSLIVLIGSISVYFFYYRDANKVAENYDAKLDINSDGIVDEEEAEKSDKVVHEKPPVEEAPVAVVIPAPAPVLELVSTAFVEEALGLASPPAIPEGAPESVRNEKTAGWWRKAA